MGAADDEITVLGGGTGAGTIAEEWGLGPGMEDDGGGTGCTVKLPWLPWWPRLAGVMLTTCGGGIFLCWCGCQGGLTDYKYNTINYKQTIKTCHLSIFHFL